MIDTNLADTPDGTRFEFDVDYVATGRSLLMFELLLDKEYVSANVSPVKAGAPA